MTERMTELDKLEYWLKCNKIEYERVDDVGIMERHQLIVYKDGERIWDAICQRGSYGYERGLLEVMGDSVVMPEDGDSVCGYLTAQDVIDRLKVEK